MRVNVTWGDIRTGKAMRASESMVALALKRELGIEYASVGLDDASLRMDRRYVTVRLPKKAGGRSGSGNNFILFFHSALNFRD